jgi:uncharacterized membrane protein
MALIGPIVSNDVFFFITILALAALMVLFDWRSRQAASPQPEPVSPVERRRQHWLARRDKMWAGAVCGSAFVFILLITAEFLYAKNQTTLSAPTEVAATDGLIRVPVQTISDGNLHRFAYSGEEGAVRFIVLRVGDRFATALDACEICGAQGYYQKDVAVFCKNCSAEIFAPTIGLAGGCNPVPLPSEIQGTDLLIRTTDLAPGSRFFQAAAVAR